MTEDQFVTLILNEEGRVYAEPPQIDQPTGPGGITLPELTRFRGTQQAIEDLKALTIDDAKRVIAQRFHDPDIAGVHDESLRVQLLDYSYNSGKPVAVRWLQRIANSFLARASVDLLTVDGVIGQRTLAVVNNLPPVPLNNALAAERAHAAYHGGVAPKFAAGVAHRAIEFTEVVG